MSIAKWIQLPKDLFTNVKMILLLNEPRGDEIALAYIRLLCVACDLEKGGWFYIGNEPCDEKCFARGLEKSPAFTKVILNTLIKYHFLEKDEDAYFIPNWYEFESENRLEKLRAYDRARKQKKRAEQKAMEDYVRWTTDGNSCR